MELIERLRKIMEQEFDIKTDRELLEAVNGMKPLDVGIFCTPIGGLENAKTA